MNGWQEVITREKLADLLNEDLSREYQAIIAYVVYSQVLKGAEYMSMPSNLRSTRIRSYSTR
jgi:bacterioferritin